MEQEALTGVIEPKTVAVIGASATPGKIGYSVVQNLVNDGFKGTIYPINPGVDEILGLKAYPSIADVPTNVDAAIITIPAKAVLSVIDDCGKKGVKGIIVITSGFSETGNRELEQELVSKAHANGIRVLGPNIIGVLSNSASFNGSFAPFLPYSGKGALISQSGALLIALDAATYTRRVGFEKLISIGNMADIDFADLIEWLDKDPNTLYFPVH